VLFLDVHHHLLPNADDAYFKDKNVKAARAIFKEKEEKPDDHVDYEFRVWRGNSFFLITGACLIWSGCVGTAHGFAIRPNLAVPEVKSAYEGSLDQAVVWFKKTL
jgi:carboxymethylenebutenolidase